MEKARVKDGERFRLVGADAWAREVDRFNNERRAAGPSVLCEFCSVPVVLVRSHPRQHGFVPAYFRTEGEHEDHCTNAFEALLVSRDSALAKSIIVKDPGTLRIPGLIPRKKSSPNAGPNPSTRSQSDRQRAGAAQQRILAEYDYQWLHPGATFRLNNTPGVFCRTTSEGDYAQVFSKLGVAGDVGLLIPGIPHFPKDKDQTTPPSRLSWGNELLCCSTHRQSLNAPSLKLIFKEGLPARYGTCFRVKGVALIVAGIGKAVVSKKGYQNIVVEIHTLNQIALVRVEDLR